MSQAPVYLDSSLLTDLRTLFADGVHQSDCMVLLVSKGVLTRPWCLLELLEAKRRGVPVLPVHIAGNPDIELQVEHMRRYIDNLEHELRPGSPAALQVRGEAPLKPPT